MKIRFKNDKLLFGFLLIGLMTGLLIVLQFRSGGLLSVDYPADEVRAKEDLIKGFLDEQLYLLSQIENLRKLIEEAQSDTDKQSSDSSLQYLEQLKSKIGLTDAKGDGVILSLEDSPFAKRESANVVDNQLIQASDIRDVINLLRASGAEAVSVNNQRILASTPISSIGTTILVNNTFVTPPFTIVAIGDQDIMLQRVLTQSLLPSIYERMVNTKINLRVEARNGITVPMFRGTLKSDHLNLVK